MIFSKIIHRESFLEDLRHVVETDEIQIHAYCLMGNHYHLLVRTPNNNLSEAMQRLSSMFTKSFNRIEKIDGPIFRGRFKSLIIGHDEYMRQLCRYIHLNPVAAGLVNAPQQYEWSSYRVYAGLVTKPEWLTVDDMPRFFTGLRDDLCAFVEKEDPTELDLLDPDALFKHRRQQDGNNIPARSLCLEKPFVDRSFKLTPASFAEVTKEVALHYRVGQEDLFSRIGNLRNTPRDVCMFLARNEACMKINDIAEAFRIHKSATSSSIARIKTRLKTDGGLKRDVANLRSRIGTYREKVPAWVEVKI
jgi:putative transposase